MVVCRRVEICLVAKFRSIGLGVPLLLLQHVRIQREPIRHRMSNERKHYARCSRQPCPAAALRATGSVGRPPAPSSARAVAQPRERALT